MSTFFRNATADTNLVRLTILPETTWGVYDTSQNPEELRITGESLTLERGTIVSEEIRSDRQVTDLIGTKIEAGGDISFEFSALTYDDLIAGAMFNSWTELVAGTARGSVGVEVVVLEYDNPATGDRFTDRVDMRFKTPQNTAVPTYNLIVGQVFRLTPSNPAQGDRFDGYFQVIEHLANPSTSVSDREGNMIADPQHYSRYIVRRVRRVNEDDFDINFPAPAGAGDDDDFYNDFQISANHQGPLDYSLNSRYITNGSNKCSFSIEKHFEDTKDRLSYSGMLVSEWNLQTEAESIVTGSFAFVGRGGDLTEAVVSSTGTRHFGQRRVGSPAANELDDMMMPILGTQEQEVGPDLTDVNARLFGDVVSASVSEIVNSGRNVSNIRLYRVNADGTQGTEITGTSNLVMSLSLAANNGTRPKLAVGDQNLVDVGIGQYNLTGDIAIYFTNASIYNRFLADEAFSVSFTIGDDEGNSYSFYMPNCKLTQSSPNAPSANADVMLESGFQVLKDRANTGTPGTDDITGTGRSLVISQIAA